METKAISVEIAVYGIDKEEADNIFEKFIGMLEAKDEAAEAAGHTFEMGSCVYGFNLLVTGFWRFLEIEEVIEELKTDTEAIREDVTVDWAIEDASMTE